jgi:hypothetical protein
MRSFSPERCFVLRFFCLSVVLAFNIACFFFIHEGGASVLAHQQNFHFGVHDSPAGDGKSNAKIQGGMYCEQPLYDVPFALPSFHACKLQFVGADEVGGEQWREGGREG